MKAQKMLSAFKDAARNVGHYLVSPFMAAKEHFKVNAKRNDVTTFKNIRSTVSHFISEASVDYGLIACFAGAGYIAPAIVEKALMLPAEIPLMPTPITVIPAAAVATAGLIYTANMFPAPTRS